MSFKIQFHQHPNIDPKTNKHIIIGSDQYKKLVKKYGPPPKIISPLTGYKISIGKGEYNKLINQYHYHENDLISLIPTPQKIKSPSGRMITLGGQQYKKYVKEEYYQPI